MTEAKQYMNLGEKSRRFCMKAIDPVAIKAAVKAGQLAFSVRYNNDILCTDTESGEAVLVKTAEAKDSKKPHTPCQYCEGTDGGHISLNGSTVTYSGVELAMSTHCKHLRARSYPNGTDEAFEAMDVVPIEFCPMCGRRL
jgi:hypothetical protein